MKTPSATRFCWSLSLHFPCSTSAVKQRPIYPHLLLFRLPAVKLGVLLMHRPHAKSPKGLRTGNFTRQSSPS